MPNRMLAGLSALVAILAAAPWWMPPWMLFIASGALAKGMVALGLILLLRGGLVSFGHALYFGIGAYAAGLLVLSGITEFLILAALGTLGTLIIAKFLRSRYGLLTKALRDNELRVEYLGQSVRHLILLNYLVAAGLAGLAGVLSAVAVGHIGPEMAYWTTSGEFVFMVILGGMGHVAAAFVGAGVLSAVQAVAYAVAPNSWQFIVGASLLACIVFLPEGLWSLLQRRGARA